jgi:hypothetical protein
MSEKSPGPEKAKRHALATATVAAPDSKDAGTAIARKHEIARGQKLGIDTWNRQRLLVTVARHGCQG